MPVICLRMIVDRGFMVTPIYHSQAREEARYEAEMRSLLREARRDFDEGRFTTDVASFVKQTLTERGLGS